MAINPHIIGTLLAIICRYWHVIGFIYPITKKINDAKNWVNNEDMNESRKKEYGQEASKNNDWSEVVQT